MGDDDFVAIDFGDGWFPLLIGSGDEEACEVFTFGVKAALGVVELEGDCGTLDNMPSGKRASESGDFLAIDAGLSPEGEAFADGFFVFGMIVIGLADIDRDSHAGVGDSERFEHGFAHQRAEAGLLEVRELDPGEGEVALPLVAPVFDEQGELGGVEAGFFLSGAVVLALIPDGTAQREGNKGGDHAVEEVGWAVLIDLGMRFLAWSAGRFHAGSFGCFGERFPASEAFFMGGKGCGLVEAFSFIVPGFDVGF